MDYQGNTNKDKENREKEPKTDKPEKVVVKVVTSDVIKKPRTLGRRFKDIFLGGNGRDALRYVTADVLLPALRDLSVDLVTRGMERVVYGESSPRRRPPYEGRVQYNRYGNSNPIDRRYVGPRSEMARLPDQNPTWRQTNKQRLGDVVIFSREEAETVVSTLIDIVDQYDVASIADYYELLGLESTAIDNKWGWSYLNNVQIRQVRQGYVIDLPPAEEL